MLLRKHGCRVHTDGACAKPGSILVRSAVNVLWCPVDLIVSFLLLCLVCFPSSGSRVHLATIGSTTVEPRGLGECPSRAQDRWLHRGRQGKSVPATGTFSLTRHWPPLAFVRVHPHRILPAESRRGWRRGVLAFLWEAEQRGVFLRGPFP